MCFSSKLHKIHKVVFYTKHTYTYWVTACMFCLADYKQYDHSIFDQTWPSVQTTSNDNTYKFYTQHKNSKKCIHRDTRRAQKRPSEAKSRLRSCRIAFSLQNKRETTENVHTTLAISKTNITHSTHSQNSRHKKWKMNDFHSWDPRCFLQQHYKHYIEQPHRSFTSPSILVIELKHTIWKLKMSHNKNTNILTHHRNYLYFPKRFWFPIFRS